MAKLTYGERKALPSSDFVEPKKRKYPIPDISHARNAEARVAQFGSSSEKAAVMSEVNRRFPAVGKKKK